MSSALTALTRWPSRAPRPRAARADDGFTLIELLIVIVILGILAAVVLFAIQAITDRGIGSACRADRSTVESASEAYYAGHHHYAPSMGALVAAGLIRETPQAGHWTVTYDPSTGAVDAVGC